jgi:hypothetical protein
MLNDHTKYLTNHLHYMLENGLVKIFKTLNSSTDPGSVFGISQAPSSLAPCETLENPPYGMPKNFTPSQAPPIMSTLSSRPETAMVISPPIVEPLNSIPSLSPTSQTNELANFIPPYQTVAYSTPPILPRGIGVPRDLVPDYYFNKYGASDRVPRTETRGVSVNSFEDYLAALREDFKNKCGKPLGYNCLANLGSTKIRIPRILIWFHIPWVGTPLILLNSMEKTIGLHGSMLVST